MNCSTLGTVLKHKDKIMARAKSAVPLESTPTSEKHDNVIEEIQKLLSVDTGSAAALSSTQLYVSSRKC